MRRKASTTLRYTPYERPPPSAAGTSSSADEQSTETVGERHRGLTAASPAAPRLKPRVSFGAAAVKLGIDKAGLRRICGTAGCPGCSVCQAELQLRHKDGEGGKRYPVSSSEKAAGLELAKIAHRRPKALDRGFCDCKDGCGPDCPCCANGIGCWWEGWLGEDGATEGWGCGCGEACRSAVRGHVYHEGEGSRQRRAVLASLNRCFEVSGEGEAANAPKAPVPDEATRVEGVPSDPPSGS